MKRQTTLRILGIMIACLLLSLIGFIVYKLSIIKDEDKPTEIVELDTIPNFGYVLEDRDTSIYKEKFEALRDILGEEEIDYEAYAQVLSELYIIDLYTMKNKMNQYDVGGLDFVLESAKENFELKVKDTIYKYMEDNTYGKRTQELPEVSSIATSDVQKTTVKIKDRTYEGYTLTVTWNYVQDLGYDTEAKITIAKIENKLAITNQSASD